MASSENATRVVVGPGDESEHLDLRLDRRAVVGEHVDPVVLREVGRRALRATGEREAARAVEAPHALAERPLGAVLERGPPSVELVVGARGFPRLVECTRRVQVLGRLREHLLEVAAALEVDQREAERPVGDASHHRDHVVADAEPRGVRLDALRDLAGDRDEQHLAEQHDLHHALAERLVPVAERLGELLGTERRHGRHVDGVFGHRDDVRVEDRALHLGQAVGRCHRGGDAGDRDADLVGVGPVGPLLLGGGERDGVDLGSSWPRRTGDETACIP